MGTHRLIVVLGLGFGLGLSGRAHAEPLEWSEVGSRLADIERAVKAAEHASGTAPEVTEEALAKRLVAGQLRLDEADYEAAATVFLDLTTNHAQSLAAIQATHFLGEALLGLGMTTWAKEQFLANLADASREARRFHQRSAARLFELAAPARPAGFAREAGPSAQPETRARLAALGQSDARLPTRGVVSEVEATRLLAFVEGVPVSEREPALTYALGRFFYLRGAHERAAGVLDALVQFEVPLTQGGGPFAAFRVRAAYVAASCLLALGKTDEALSRFAALTKARPSAVRDRQIVELSWLALGRIHHDAKAWNEAIAAYRQLGRGSAYFSEALYELAWTLLRAGRGAEAIVALDLFLRHAPASSLVAEVRTLRAKVRILERDHLGAEAEYAGLGREFAELRRRLGSSVRTGPEVASFVVAQAAEDSRHFDPAVGLPAEARPWFQALPVPASAVGLTRSAGALDDELFELRALLARMEDALRAREKARFFPDLSAHLFGLESAEADLLEVRTALVFRLARATDGSTRREIAKRVATARETFERVRGARGLVRTRIGDALAARDDDVRRLEAELASVRAELVALEISSLRRGTTGALDPRTYLRDASALRSELRTIAAELRRLRATVQRSRDAMRWHDPLAAAEQAERVHQLDELQRLGSSLRKSGPLDEVAPLWARVEALEVRLSTAKGALERAAEVRLRLAAAVLTEERANLDGAAALLRDRTAQVQATAGQAVAAGYRDLLLEVDDLVLRAEVGLLDLAFAMKEAEAEEARTLERQREEAVRDVDRAVQLGLEELGR